MTPPEPLTLPIEIYGKLYDVPIPVHVHIVALEVKGAGMPCEWREDDDGDWWTGCNNGYVIFAGTPADNFMKFCCYCGGELKEVPYVFDDSDGRIIETLMEQV